jgi:hypothetical protein
MTELEQFTTLRTWILAITDLPEIIRAHPDAPRPSGVYGVLNLVNANRINWPDDYDYAQLDGSTVVDTGDDYPTEQIPVEQWEYQWSFHLYGPGGADQAARLISAARSDAALLRLHPLTLHRTSMVRRVPELIENVWEERAQIDLFVHARVRHGFKSDRVDTARVSAQNDDGGTFGPSSVTAPDE